MQLCIFVFIFVFEFVSLFVGKRVIIYLHQPLSDLNRFEPLKHSSYILTIAITNIPLV